VTGGGRGIGRAIAGALTRAGATVTVLGRDEATLRRVIEAGDAQAFVVADVRNEAAVQAAFAEATEAAGPPDIVIANAGAAESAPFARSDAALFERMLALNLMGVVHASRQALGPMTERGFGRIVAIASTAGLKGYPYVSAYCAAKHAVVGFVRALAQETARSGVTVNAICPGFSDTALVAESLERIVAKTGRSRDAALAQLVAHNPQGRLIDPAEVADTVLWLCGEKAGAVTGQAIAIAGGEV